MRVTRRSFIKKSSYSAAAISVLGTGVALADGATSNLPLKWRTHEINILTNTAITFTSDVQLTLPNDKLDIQLLMIASMMDPTNPNNLTKSRPNIVNVKVTEGRGGTIVLNPPVISITQQFPNLTMPQQGTWNPQTQKYEFTVQIPNTAPKFKMTVTYRK